jgi:hypothetical protein
VRTTLVALWLPPKAMRLEVSGIMQALCSHPQCCGAANDEVHLPGPVQ